MFIEDRRRRRSAVIVVHEEGIVTATSPESWGHPALNAVDRTRETVESLQWAVVQDQSIKVDVADEPTFETKVNIGFEGAE